MYKILARIIHVPVYCILFRPQLVTDKEKLQRELGHKIMILNMNTNRTVSIKTRINHRLAVLWVLGNTIILKISNQLDYKIVGKKKIIIKIKPTNGIAGVVQLHVFHVLGTSPHVEAVVPLQETTFVIKHRNVGPGQD